MARHMRSKYCGDCYDISCIERQYSKVTAFGRHHKRGGPAFGRATSFVVSCALGLDKVNIVAVTAILVLHVGNSPKMNFQGRENTRHCDPLISSTSLGVNWCKNHPRKVASSVGFPTLRSDALPSPSDRAIERSIERSSDRSIEQSIERSRDRAIERSSDRAIKRSSDQATERSSDRATERPSDRATERPSDRATERPSDRR